jgi:transposase
LIKIRQALYMPVLVAMRFNPNLKRVYNRLIDQGKHAKLAITTIMRRLIILANALLPDDRTWSPKPVCL